MKKQLGNVQLKVSDDIYSLKIKINICYLTVNYYLHNTCISLYFCDKYLFATYTKPFLLSITKDVKRNNNNEPSLFEIDTSNAHTYYCIKVIFNCLFS